MYPQFFTNGLYQSRWQLYLLLTGNSQSAGFKLPGQEVICCLGQVNFDVLGMPHIKGGRVMAMDEEQANQQLPTSL